MKQLDRAKENSTFPLSLIKVDESKELRCPECGKLLAKGDLGQGGSIEQKCLRCKRLCRFEKL